MTTPARRPSSTNLRCRLCTRTLLAHPADLVPHTPGPGQVAFEPRKRDPRWAVVPRTQQRGVGGVGPERVAGEGENAEGEGEGEKEEAEGGGGGGGGSSAVGAQLEDTTDAPQTQPQPQPQPQSQTRPIQTAASLTSRLPPHLAALRLLSPSNPSLPSTPSHSASTTACSSHFVEPQPWMGPMLDRGETRGRIVCPNGRCMGKLGSWDWAGAQCACGAWVTPAFALHASRVDAV